MLISWSIVSQGYQRIYSDCGATYRDPSEFITWRNVKWVSRRRWSIASTGEGVNISIGQSSREFKGNWSSLNYCSRRIYCSSPGLSKAIYRPFANELRIVWCSGISSPFLSRTIVDNGFMRLCVIVAFIPVIVSSLCSSVRANPAPG